MESKLLNGGGKSFVEIKTNLAARKEEVELKKLRETELQTQLAQRAKAVEHSEETYTSLQQEVKVKSKKLEKLYCDLQLTKKEIEGMLLCGPSLL